MTPSLNIAGESLTLGSTRYINPVAHSKNIGLDFLTYLSATLVPRLQLGYVLADDVKEGYFARIHEEHAAIVAAIEEQSGDLARRMMRQHLTNSLARLRALELSAGKSLLANTAP